MHHDTKCILAIDPSLSSTGWAVIGINTQMVEKGGAFKTSAKETTDERIHSVCRKLFEEARKYPIAHIILEDGYIGNNAKTGLQLASLRGALIEIFTWYGYKVHHMKPTEIRSMFAQKGNASKEDIANAIRAFYGEDSTLIAEIGPYSDKQNKSKTSDIYDAISIGLAYIRAKSSKLVE